MEFFDVPKTKKQTEYTKAYSLVYDFTNDKKLQDKLLEYVNFRTTDCKAKGYRFYSSSIKSFLDSIDNQMGGSSVDEIWEAVNLTLSYSSMRLLVPYKNNKKRGFDDLIRKDESYDNVSHVRSDKEF